MMPKIRCLLRGLHEKVAPVITKILLLQLEFYLFSLSSVTAKSEATEPSATAILKGSAHLPKFGALVTRASSINLIPATLDESTTNNLLRHQSAIYTAPAFMAQVLPAKRSYGLSHRSQASLGSIGPRVSGY
jgi:hypothetical protein